MSVRRTTLLVVSHEASAEEARGPCQVNEVGEDGLGVWREVLDKPFSPPIPGPPKSMPTTTLSMCMAPPGLEGRGCHCDHHGR